MFPRPSLFVSALSFAALFSLHLSARAQNTRVEAETKLAAGDLKVVADPLASGGHVVSMPREWQPLLVAPLPATGADFTIWVRYALKPVLLKADLPGGQKDLTWLWDAPNALTWKRAGRYSRAEIGKNLVVIRGADGGDGPQLDCVIFATDDAYDPNQDAQSLAPAAATAPATANTTPDNAAPKATIYEAEAFAQAKVIDDVAASGGKAVQSDNDWQPLVKLALPTGDAFKVRVRSKGGPFAIKVLQNGKTQDRWVWDAPKTWTWLDVGTLQRAELPDATLTLQRNDGGAKPDSAEIDAIELTPAIVQVLPAELPDPKAAPVKVSASVNWKAREAVLSPMLWGINEQEVLRPERARDAKYQQLLGDLKTPLIRIHQGDLVEQWTNLQTRDWDAAKIKAGFAAASGYGNAKVMLCINALPSWIANGEVTKMSEADEDAFASFCARLVSVMRDDVKRRIDYWEVPNEWDDKFEQAGKLPQLWRIYNKCAAAMHKVDPHAKIGGGAFTWAKPAWIKGFLENCPDAQFLSWHNYASGDVYESNARVFDKAFSDFGGNARGVLQAIRASGRKLETFLDETNVDYSWQPDERRHRNTIGALFLALAVRESARSGINNIALWQQKGNAYGTLWSGENQTRPAYWLYQRGPKFLSGILRVSTTGNAQQLQLLPITRADGRKSLLLLNLAPHALLVPPAKTLLPNVARMEQLNAAGEAATPPVSSGEMTLPGYSLTLLTEKN